MSEPSGVVSKENIDQIVRMIQFRRRGVPAELVQITLLEAARELAQAKVANHSFTLNGGTGENNNDFDFRHCIPEGYEFLAVETVKVCGTCIEPYAKCDPCPSGYKIISETCIRIEPCPSGEIDVCLVVRPNFEHCDISRCLMRHREYLLDKVDGELALMEGEEWASASTARFRLRRAQGRKTSIAVRETRGHSCAPCITTGSRVI
jgi:hypothetical protein